MKRFLSKFSGKDKAADKPSAVSKGSSKTLLEPDPPMPPAAELEAQFEALLDTLAIPAAARPAMLTQPDSRKWKMIVAERKVRAFVCPCQSLSVHGARRCCPGSGCSGCQPLPGLCVFLHPGFAHLSCDELCSVVVFALAPIPAPLWLE